MFPARSRAGTVGAPQAIVNVTGSCSPDVDVSDANGDNRMDAVVFVGGEIEGSLPGGHLGACVVTFLDPFGLDADAFAETPYRFSPLDPAGNGRGLTHGDFDGDRLAEIVVGDERDAAARAGSGGRAGPAAAIAGDGRAAPILRAPS